MKRYFRLSSRFFLKPQWVAAFALGAMVGPAVAQQSADSQTEPTSGAQGGANRPTASERAFLEQARELLRQQRRLGELGQSQARESDVRSHALNIVTDYRQMLERLDGLTRKQGIALRNSAEVPSDAYRELAAKSGPEFERSFVVSLSELHERTLALFEQAAADARERDVRQFAAAQLPALREHRNRITVLRKQLE